MPLCNCWANMERSGSILRSCRASQGAAHTPPVAPIKSGPDLFLTALCVFILGNSGSNRYHSSTTTLGLHMTASMCAQTLKESDRKCEHSFAELFGAPSAHPSGGKNEFQNEEFKKNIGVKVNFLYLATGCKGLNRCIRSLSPRVPQVV